MIRSATLTATVLLSLACGSQAGDYPRPELLVEPVTLAKPETLKGFVILDARTKAKYEAGHVPESRWVDHSEWAKNFGDGKDTAAWSKRVGNLGLTPDSHVVVYDDNQAKDAARVWWILRYWGVKDVRLLNGGWIGWEKGKHPIVKAETVIKSSVFKAAAAPERMATKDELLKSLTGEKLQIVDARSEDEFCGIEGIENKRAGAIPGENQLE